MCLVLFLETSWWSDLFRNAVVRRSCAYGASQLVWRTLWPLQDHNIWQLWLHLHLKDALYFFHKAIIEFLQNKADQLHSEICHLRCRVAVLSNRVCPLESAGELAQHIIKTLKLLHTHSPPTLLFSLMLLDLPSTDCAENNLPCGREPGVHVAFHSSVLISQGHVQSIFKEQFNTLY